MLAVFSFLPCSPKRWIKFCPGSDFGKQNHPRSVVTGTQPGIEPDADALLRLQHITSRNPAKVAAPMGDGRRGDPTIKGPRTGALFCRLRKRTKHAFARSLRPQAVEEWLIRRFCGNFSDGNRKRQSGLKPAGANCHDHCIRKPQFPAI